MEEDKISFHRIKKQILLLAVALTFAMVICGAVSAADTGQCDLAISGAATTIPPSAVFAGQTNNVRVTNIKNNGPDASPATVVSLYASDVSSTVPVSTSNIPSLASGGTCTLTLNDPTIRPVTDNTTYGSSNLNYVTYTIKIDPNNSIAETNETNNVKTIAAKPVYYNGYDGKRNEYNPGGDVTTKHTYDLRGGLVYSSGDSVYRSGSFGSGGWTTYDVHWNSTDLPIPSTGTVKEAWLYVPYTWDDSNDMPDNVSLVFNGQTIKYVDWYYDQSNFGGYPNYIYGLLTYNVTSLFNANENNTATFTRPGATDKLSMYGFTLAVVYKDPTATRKQIFLNEEFDLLGASISDYDTTPELATAYIPFSGMTIDTSKVSNATLVTFVPSGDSNEGNLLFNGQQIASNVWDYGSSTGTQVAIDVRNVTSYLSSNNIAAIQATARPSPCMVATQQFMVIEYNEITASPTGGIFKDPLNVSLEAIDPQDVIYYTTDGTDPTTSSNVYNGSINISKTTVLKFRAVTAQGISSEIYTQNYYISPHVNSVDPVNNAIINIKNMVISVTFNEDIKEGSDYDNITLTGPSGKVNATKTINGNVLSLTPASELTDGNYILNLPVNCISDIVDNGLAFAFSSKFTVDTTTPVVSSLDPLNNAIINIKNKIIKITFSENIQAGSNYNNIKITGPSGAVNITKSITGKILTLTPASNYSNGVYTINIPVNAIKDMVGNGLVVVYTSKFTVDTLKPTAKASPAGGYYNTAKSVALSMSESGNIYYTLDGTIPTTKSTRYYKSLYLSTSKVLRFLAVDLAGNLSSVYTQKYVVDKKAPTASATPSTGSYKNTIKVTLGRNELGNIYFTLNGTTPTIRSAKYTGPFYLLTSKTLKFMAVDLAGNKSPVYTKTYTIKDITPPKIVSAQPVSNASKIPVNQIIRISFSEPIKVGSTYNSITLKNSAGRSMVITKSIISNVLIVKLAKGTYSKNTKYTLNIPAKAVNDMRNNSLSAAYRTSFITTKT